MEKSEELELRLKHQTNVEHDLRTQLADEISSGSRIKYDFAEKLQAKLREIDSLVEELRTERVKMEEMSENKETTEERLRVQGKQMEELRTSKDRLEEDNKNLKDELERIRLQLSECDELKTIHKHGDAMSQSCHPLLTAQTTTPRSETPPTFERESFQVGGVVYVVFSEETKQYILLRP